MKTQVHTSALDTLQKMVEKLDADNKMLIEALKEAECDINWMLNEKKFLSGFCFNYIDEAIAKATE